MRHSSDLIVNSTLYSNHIEYKSMIEQIQNYVNITELPIRIILFTSRKDNKLLFTEISSKEFKIEKQHYANGIFVGELSRKFGRKEQKNINGRFLLFKHEDYDINIIVTHEDSTFFDQALLAYIKKLYPSISLPFFYSWEIESMLNNLAKYNVENILMLTKLSRKTRITSESSRRRKESDLTWTDLPYKEVFKQTRQNNAWMEKVDFDLINEIQKSSIITKQKVLTGSISRNGVFKCELGFKLFYKTVIEKGIGIFFDRKEKFSNRARIKETNYESRPFFIKFNEAIFTNKEQNYRLIETLKNMPHLGYSVVHANPYLHMTATDYIDNSNYEIWILSDDKITIAPQTVCSMSALNRLCDHISKEFEEGHIKEVGELN